MEQFKIEQYLQYLITVIPLYNFYYNFEWPLLPTFPKNFHHSEKFTVQDM